MSFIVNPSITPPFTAGGVAYGTGSGAKVSAAGTATQLLQSNGAGAPSWVTSTAGTVSSVAMTVPSVLSVSGSPITTSGTLALSYSGTALPIANGGTGSTTLTANNVLLGNGTSALQAIAPGTSGNALTSNGTTWTSSALTGGSTTQLQYNNAGAFGGISGVTTDGTRITASTTIGVGGATPSTSGSGITFPATQSASTNANTLDDYEEGTWTLGSIEHQGTATSFTTSGNYVKIGLVVYILGFLTPTNGTFASYARTTGLPFTVSVFGSGGMCNFTNLDTPGSLSFSTQSSPIAWVFNASVPSGCKVIFSGFYLTT